MERESSSDFELDHSTAKKKNCTRSVSHNDIEIAGRFSRAFQIIILNKIRKNSNKWTKLEKLLK